MKFEENWLRGLKEEVVKRCRQTGDGRKVITIAHLSGSGEIKRYLIQ